MSYKENIITDINIIRLTKSNEARHVLTSMIIKMLVKIKNVLLLH